MKKKSCIFLLIPVFFAVILFSCNKENIMDDIPVYDPTPYAFIIPSWVNQSIGDLPEPMDNPTTITGVELGRKLFYDKMLSNDFTISCASCHKQQNAFDDPRPFSQGTNFEFGDRNAMAIINQAWATSFFWDGRQSTLEAQAHDPVTNPIEMANTWPVVINRLQNHNEYPDLFFKAFNTATIDSILVFKAIAQFERTLISYNSRFDKYYFEGDETQLTAQEVNGMDVFFGAGKCNNCHTDPLMTDNAFRNNGLDLMPVDSGRAKFTQDINDFGKFKVPTLRNIELTGPYMHDSRFTTLEETIEHYSSAVISSSPNLDEHMVEFGTGLNLTSEQKEDLVAFLKSLTDESFINNPEFSDPGN